MISSVAFSPLLVSPCKAKQKNRGYAKNLPLQMKGLLQGKHCRLCIWTPISPKKTFLTRTAASSICRNRFSFSVIFCAKPWSFRGRHHLRFSRRSTPNTAVCFVVKNGIVFMWRKWRTFFHLSEPIRSQERQSREFRPISLRLPEPMERNSNAQDETQTDRRRREAAKTSKIFK